MTAAELLARAERRTQRWALAHRSATLLIPFLLGSAAAFAFDRWIRPAPDGPEIHEARARVDAAQVVRAAAVERAAVSLAVVDSTRARTEVARRRSVNARQLAIVIDDTTIGVRVTPSAPILAAQIPAVVIARIVTDSLRILELEHGTVKRDAAIADLLGVVAADSAVIDAQARQITLLERSRAPRCGVRCGIAIGAGSVIAAAIGLRQVR